MRESLCRALPNRGNASTPYMFRIYAHTRALFRVPPQPNLLSQPKNHPRLFTHPSLHTCPASLNKFHIGPKCPRSALARSVPTTVSSGLRQAAFHCALCRTCQTLTFPQGFCLNRVGLVVRVEGQGLARRFFVHWDDHPAKVVALSVVQRHVVTITSGIASCAGEAKLDAL